MGKIPPEVQAQIDAFNAEEAKRLQDRSSYGDQQLTKKKRKLIERITSGTVFTPRELMSYANDQGWQEAGSEGSHRTFIHEDGRKITIPLRTGKEQTIQPDTAKRILNSIFPELFAK